MNVLTILLQAAPANGGMGGSGFIIMMVAVFAIMYFFMIRPQNKKQKAIQKFRNELAIGQEVMTAGGIYGKVKEIDGATNTVILEIAPNVKIKMDRNSIYQDATSAAAVNTSSAK